MVHSTVARRLPSFAPCVIAIFRDLVSAEFRPRFSKKGPPEPSSLSASRVKSTSHYSKIASLSCYVINETRDTYEKILWPLDRPIVQLETFEVREPSISARDAKLERRSRPTGAHKARHGFESHFRVVAVTPLRAGTPHASLGKPQDTRSFRRSPCRLLPLTKPPRRAPRPGPTSPAFAASPAPPR